MSALDYLIQRAKVDPVAFIQLVLKDEITGAPLDLTESHKDFVRFLHTHDRSVQWSYPEFGKSTLLSGYAAFRAGQDPSIRIVYSSGTELQAQRHVQHFKIHVTRTEYSWVFPGRTIERSTSDSVYLTGRPDTMTDPTIVTGAPGLSSLQGRRADMALADDVVPLEQRHSQTRRDVDYANFLANLGSRLTPTGAIHVVGTAEHPDDLMHRLAKLPGYQSRKYPVRDSQGRSTFPARWPEARITQRELELGPVRALASLMAEASTEGALCFRDEDLQRALSNGAATEYSDIPSGRVVIGCDPAWTSRPGADESGIAMVLVDDTGYRHLSLVEGWRIPHERLVDRLVELARANRATVYIESNGAGGLIADAVAKRAPCRASPTSRSSKESQVEQLSAELASGRWIFRQGGGYPSPELRKLIGELQLFSFDRHAGDRCMALLQAVSGIRAVESRPKGGWRPGFDLLSR